MNKLFLCIALVCAAFLFAGCSSPEKSESDYLASAQAYLDAAEFDAAIIELKNALQVNPGNPQARLLLGELHLKYGAAANAEKELSRAGELTAEQKETLPLLGQALVLQGRHDEVQEFSVDDLDDNARASVLASQGLARLAQGQLQFATDLIDQAVAANPKSTYALIARAQLLNVNREREEAQEVLDSIFLIDPGYHPAWSLLGDIQQKQSKLALAESSYSRALLNNPNKFNLILKRAYVRISLEDFDGAQADIDSIRGMSPLHPGVNYLQGLVYFHHRNLEEAKAAFELTLMNKERHLMVLYYMAVTNYMLGQSDDAEVYAKEYYFRDASNSNIRLLFAKIRYENKDYMTAEQLLRPVYSEDTEDPFLLNFMANILMAQGKTDEGIAILEKVAQLNPDSAPAQMRLGRGFLSAGQEDSAVKQIEIAVNLSPQFQKADALLIIHYTRQQDYEIALEKANQYRDNNPDSALAFNLLGGVLQALGQRDETLAAFNKARALAPGDPAASHKLASYALADDDPELARRYYNAVLEHYQNYESTLLKLSALDLLEGKEKRMVEHLEAAIAAHPSSIEPRVVLARYYLRRNKPGQARMQFNGLNEVQLQKPPVLTAIVLSHLAEHNWADARYTLANLERVKPGSAETHFLYAKAYTGQGYQQRALAELLRAVELAPEYFAAHLELAQIYMSQAQMEDFEQELEILRLLSPGDEKVLKMEAFLAGRNGEEAKARDFYITLLEQYPRTYNMLLLARQLWHMGDRDRAITLQERWLNQHPEDIRARSALASAYTRQAKPLEAIDQYRKILDLEQDNLNALKNLAWLQRRSDPKQALKYAERAMEIRPESATLTDLLAMVLLTNGEADKARRYSARALERKPGDPTLKYHNAMILAASGDTSLAADQLTSLLAEDVNFSERADAVMLLAQLRPAL